MKMFIRNVTVILVVCVLSYCAGDSVEVLKKHTYYNTTVFELTFYDVGLKEIELEAFKDCSVDSLSIFVNPLETLRKGIFVNVSIHEVRLPSNQIKTIEPGTFHELHPLDGRSILTLEMSNNKLEGVQKGLFNNTTFRRLLLSSNRIKYIEPGAFEGMTYLYLLEMDENLLERIGTGVFQNLVPPSSWVELAFRGNNLSFVDPYAFENTVVYSLDLQRNSELGELNTTYFKNTSIGTIYLYE